MFTLAKRKFEEETGLPWSDSSYLPWLEKLVEEKFTSTNNARDEICHCTKVYPVIAIEGLIKMGFPYCPRCGGKLSPVA